MAGEVFQPSRDLICQALAADPSDETRLRFTCSNLRQAVPQKRHNINSFGMKLTISFVTSDVNWMRLGRNAGEGVLVSAPTLIRLVVYSDTGELR
jgi:hypothetical protein